MRLFDAHKRGAMYRILCSRIMRKQPEQLAYHNGFLSELSKRYADDRLCAFFTDAELADALDVCEKSIKNYRDDLLAAKLVKIEKYNDGYIYTLGVVMRFKDKDGYEIGAESEAYYIDHWVTMADQEPDKLEGLLLRLFGTEKMKSGKSASSTKKSASQRKNIPKIEKIFSKNEGTETPEKPAPSGQEEGGYIIPIEDNTYRNDVNTPTLSSAGTPEYRTIEIQEALSGLQNTKFPLSAISQARKAINLGANRVMVERMLMKRAPQAFYHEKMPRFSIMLGAVHNAESISKYSEQTRIVRLYTAFKEDVTHTYTPPKGEGSSEWMELAHAARELLEKFSYEQIVWTMRTLTKGQKTTLEFAAQGIHTMHRVINQHAKDYQGYLALKEEKAKLVLEQERDRERRKEQQHVTTTIKPAVSQEEREANRRKAALAKLGLEED